MDIEAIRKLLGLIREAPPAPAAPDINEARPWDSPVLRDPSMRAVPPSMMQGSIATTTPGSAMTPMDDALVQALLRKRIQQELAGATGNPIPR